MTSDAATQNKRLNYLWDEYQCESEKAKSGTMDTARFLELQRQILQVHHSEVMTFERWLLSLSECPDLLRYEAQTDSEIRRYKNVLDLWQAHGRPHPGLWPDAYEFPVPCSFTREWIIEHENKSF